MGVGRPITRTNFYQIEMKRLEVKWGGGKRPNARTTGSEKTGRVFVIYNKIVQYHWCSAICIARDCQLTLSKEIGIGLSRAYF